MGKHNGHRVTITLSDHEYGQVKAYIRKYGFKGISELTRSLYALVMWHDFSDSPSDTEDAETIRKAFDEYAHVMRQPDGTVPKRNRRNDHGP